MKIARWGMAIALCVGSAGYCASAPQQQDKAQEAGTQPSSEQAKTVDPLVAAARRAREQQKKQPKASKVWTNEDIPSGPGGLSIAGKPVTEGAEPSTESSAKSSESASGAADATKTENAKGSADADAIRAQLKSAEDNLKNVQAQLDLLQRTYKLDEQMYYVKPDYSADTAGAAKLKDEQSQIDSKQQDVADAQKQVDDLQTKLQAATSTTTDSTH